ncbi:MAG: Gfo/Idh/MocA family oxidoreductase [Nanoarchaeota archaeon]|nr:Gfo/Idh/MocA family oxidoreductase [Nanoarchaeota archaeon]
MRSDIVKLAFVGTGNIAEQHMKYLKEFTDVKIVGLYDINEETLLKGKRQFGGDAYKSIDQMLDNSCPDAVYICLPPFAHGKAEFACIERGIHFLVEKPLSNDLNLAEKIANEVSASEIITCSAYMNRYRRGVNEAKKLLAKYPISLVYGGWLFDTPNNHPWITQKKLSGGQLLEQTTHLFDLVRYLCGEVLSVHCYGSKLIVPQTNRYDVEDATVVSMQLQSGAVANIQSSWSVGFDKYIYLNLFGPDIQVEFRNWEFDTRIKSRGTTVPFEIPGEKDIFAIESRAFLDAVKQNDPTKILCDYVNGVRSLKVSFAANKSLKTGNSIQLDSLDTTEYTRR